MSVSSGGLPQAASSSFAVKTPKNKHHQKQDTKNKYVYHQKKDTPLLLLMNFYHCPPSFVARSARPRPTGPAISAARRSEGKVSRGAEPVEMQVTFFGARSVVLRLSFRFFERSVFEVGLKGKDNGSMLGNVSL